MDKNYLYQKIYDSLLEEIRAGKRKPGDFLPTEFELAEQYAVSRITSRRALQLLAEQGYVDRVPGRGTCVRLPAEPMKTIGLALSNFGTMFGTDLVRGVLSEAHRLGYYVLIESGYNTDTEESERLCCLAAAGVSGLIHVPLYSSAKDTGALNDIFRRLPVVFADRKISGPEIPLVCTDNIAATEMLCRKLREFGHRQIAFVSGSLNSSTVAERYKGFVRYSEVLGIPLERRKVFSGIRSILPGMDSRERAEEDIRALTDFLTRNIDVTAIIAHTFRVADLARSAIKRLGFRIPEDYSVVCFDAPNYSDGTEFYAHIRQNEYEMGKCAVRRLDELVRGNVIPPVTYVNAEYVPGFSCGPVR